MVPATTREWLINQRPNISAEKRLLGKMTSTFKMYQLFDVTVLAICSWLSRGHSLSISSKEEKKIEATWDE